MKRIVGLAFLAVTLTTAQMGCERYAPDINPADFVSTVDNQYFPLTPGTLLVYDEPGGEHIEFYVTNQTKVVMDVTCVVVRDRVTVNGELAEETFDWYAQDKDGNVWYFGEDSKEYENGKVVSTEGSWEGGLDKAQPGIIMEANPKIGDEYRQEYYKGEAEDMAKVVSLTESVSVPYDTFENCLMTDEWTPLEPGVAENKYYAKGVGCVLETAGMSRVELISVTTDTTE